MVWREVGGYVPLGVHVLQIRRGLAQEHGAQGERVLLNAIGLALNVLYDGLQRLTLVGGL